MKKTIREDDKRRVIAEKYLNDNAKIEHVMEEQKIYIVLRYVERYGRSIREIPLLTLELDNYLEEFDNLFRISEDNKAVSIFSKTNAGYKLERLLDVETYTFAVDGYQDILYKKRFPESKLTKRLLIEK